MALHVFFFSLICDLICITGKDKGVVSHCFFQFEIQCFPSVLYWLISTVGRAQGYFNPIHSYRKKRKINDFSKGICTEMSIGNSASRSITLSACWLLTVVDVKVQLLENHDILINLFQLSLILLFFLLQFTCRFYILRLLINMYLKQGKYATMCISMCNIARSKNSNNEEWNYMTKFDLADLCSQIDKALFWYHRLLRMAANTFTSHTVYVTKYFTELSFKCRTLDLSHWLNRILSKYDSQFKSRHRWCARISIINIEDGRKFRKNIYKNLPPYHIKTMCSLAINKVK